MQLQSISHAIQIIVKTNGAHNLKMKCQFEGPSPKRLWALGLVG